MYEYQEACDEECTKGRQLMKIKEVDFLFVYEVKSREIENIMLIGYHLMKAGYSVAYVNTWESMNTHSCAKYNANVVITFAAYDTGTIKFVLRFCHSAKKIVNMQWEQLLNEAGKKGNRYYFSGWAKRVVHLSWGEDNYRRLVHDSGIEDKYVKLVGHISTDFLSPQFANYYLSRNAICEEYAIDTSKKICLFVSTFSFVDIPQKIAQECKVDNEFITFSNDSQKEILYWIDQYTSSHEDVVFIYRPHPAEKQNERLLSLAKKNPRIKVISDYSIKQWFVISDIIYNWYSTSILEMFAYTGNNLVPPQIEENVLYNDVYTG